MSNTKRRTYNDETPNQERNVAETCSNCKFWHRSPVEDPVEDIDDTGECCRFPPTLSSSENTDRANEVEERLYRTQFPVTLDAQWCGEWRSLPQESVDG